MRVYPAPALRLHVSLRPFPLADSLHMLGALRVPLGLSLFDSDRREMQEAPEPKHQGEANEGWISAGHRAGGNGISDGE